MLTLKLFYIGGGNEKQWTVLRHNGPIFPPEYIPHKIPVMINGKSVVLPELAEEYATMYAKYIESDYVKNNIFNKNFWKDFKPTLKDINVTSLDQIDFSLIKKHLDNIKEQKIKISKEEKGKEEEPYMYCIINGNQQQVGNYKIEPPGIFLGRGTHPKSGRIKKRIYPEDVTLNLDKEAPIPKPNLPNHKWKEIIHDQSVIWLATWKENVLGTNKYIYTSFESFFKSKSDEDKFDLAKKLKKKINSIKESYEKELESSNLKKKQLATALYFIDNLALRVGGKKDSKEQADTVGVTSLRVEHITFLENNTIKLDFLGKDSIRYCRKIQVNPLVYKNLEEFTKNKSKKEELFELITSATLNEYLDSFMEGLTAKVWRTFNASLIFQKELDKLTSSKKLELYTEKEEQINYLLMIFHQANTAVALLCNHQKASNTNIEAALKKLDQKIKELKKKRDKYKDKKNTEKMNQIKKKIELAKIKKESKIKMKNVSLGTSIQNYIDPRILYAFIKKYDIPEKRVFKSDKLISRFKWASLVNADYRF